MRRRAGRGRGGPGLLGTVARTAVIAGTAQAVAGRVAAGQGAAAHQQASAHQAAAQQAAAQQAAAQQAAANHAAQRPSVDDLHAQLLKLGELRQAGLLTDSEFEQQKARLLTP